MKCIVILCVVLLALTVVSAKKKAHNNEEKEKSMKKAVKECQRNEETRVDGAILKKLRKQKQVELPENYGDHKLCVLKGVGVLGDDNIINTETLKKRITKKAKDDQDIEAIVSECGESQQDSKSTAMHIEKCLIKYSIDI
nr:odorant binding protein 19 [Pachyrhinus yasumatsui]